jgi:sulfopyruvate decarboxylase subunit beta
MTMLTLPELLSEIQQQRGDEVVISTMTAGLLAPFYSDSLRDLSYTAPMGSAGAVGLGLAIARPDLRVLVIDGDGSLLMNLGVLVSSAGAAPANLVHVVCHNGCYSITGEQPLPGPSDLSFSTIARACGWKSSFDVASKDEWRSCLSIVLNEDGPHFVSAKMEVFDKTLVTKEMKHSATSMSRRARPGFRNLRQELQSTHLES